MKVALSSYDAKALGPYRAGEAPSPDGRWSVLVQDHNLFVRDVATDELRRLTTDGTAAHAYGELSDPVKGTVFTENYGRLMPPLVVWSPDSTRFVSHRLDQRDIDVMHLVRSSPMDGSRPRPLTYRYSLVGDETVATSQLFVFDAASGEVTPAKGDPIITPFVPTIGYGFVWWSDDGRTVWYLTTNRGDSQGWLNELDAATGETRVLVEEATHSHLLFGPAHYERNVRVLSTGEVLWWSQRSDWGHLYLYGTDGSVRTLTEGEWNVRAIVDVDEQSRRVVITGAGRGPGSDPYLQELYSLSLDSGELTALTSDGLDHDTAPSPTGAYFVDVTSRYDTPTVSVLRDRTGAVVMELEKADPTRLYEAGWTPPERVVVKAADGVTDIHCAVYKPLDFDPTQKYAVIDEIYPGPQNQTVTLRFPGSGGVMVGANEHSSHAALGFVVVSIDGRGSALRSKSFQDVARVSGDPAFVHDHAEAIKQLAADRPWMDLDRVGIFGHSAGGYGSARVLLNRPDVFKVAVSSCGNHDNRVNHSWWGEKWFGMSEDFDFEAQSNASVADKLEGKLFLLHGEMDDNAVPHGTMRLVDALIAANKDFDFLMLPSQLHNDVLISGYWVRKRWDYFVQHLLGETPPPYQVEDALQRLV